jgi:hypothetical protein
MKDFSRSGFRLRRAPPEVKLAYTAFLALVVPGIASMVALSIGRIGVTPTAIATYYRGGLTEMSFPKPLWQLMEEAHFHLFSIPVVLLILTHLLFATDCPPRWRTGLTLASFVGAFVEIFGPFAVRYLAAGFAWVLPIGWLLLCLGMLGCTIVSLVAIWGPE